MEYLRDLNRLPEDDRNVFFPQAEKAQVVPAPANLEDFLEQTEEGGLSKFVEDITGNEEAA
jgi:hypothetical protein